MKHHTKHSHIKHTKEDIIRIAKEFFIRRGYSNTSMEEIAEAIGIQKASLYYFFANKEEIFLAIIQSGFDHLDAFFKKVTPDTSLEHFIRGYLRLCMKNKIIVRLLDSRVMTEKMKKKVIGRVIDMRKKMQTVLKSRHVRNSELAMQLIVNSVFAYVLHCGLVRQCPAARSYGRYLSSIIK